MTRRLLTALTLLACTVACSDGPTATVVDTTLPDGFLMMAGESDEQANAPAATPTAPTQPTTLPASLLVPSGLEGGQVLDGTTGIACDELTIKYRSTSCFNDDLNWFTFRPGAPLTVLVEGNRSSGGRWTRDTLELEETDLTNLSAMLDLFREGFEQHWGSQMGVTFDLTWKMDGETVATEQLHGDMTPYLGDAPPPFTPIELIGRCRNKR